MFLIPSETIFPELALFDERERAEALSMARNSNRPVWFWLCSILVGWLIISAAFVAWRVAVASVVPHNNRDVNERLEGPHDTPREGRNELRARDMRRSYVALSTRHYTSVLVPGIVRDVFVHTLVPVSATCLSALAITAAWRSRIRRSLREQLQHRGVPICVPCGYDLRGQVEPRCPECGVPFDPKLLVKPAGPGDDPGSGAPA